MLNKELYTQAIKTWKETKEHTVHDHVLYNILRNKPADYGFIEIKNIKRINSGDSWITYNNAIDYIVFCFTTTSKHWFEREVGKFQKTFGIEFTPEVIQSILPVLKKK